MGRMACVFGSGRRPRSRRGRRRRGRVGSRRRMGQELEWCLLRDGRLSLGFLGIHLLSYCVVHVTLADAAPIVVLVLRAWSIGSGSGLEVGAKSQTHIYPPDPLSLFALPTTQAPGHRREKGASNKSRRPPPATARAAFHKRVSIHHTSSFLGAPSLPSENTLFSNFDRLRECAASDKVRGSLSSWELGHQHSTAPPWLAQCARHPLTSEKASDPPSPSHAFSSLHPTKPADACTSPRTRYRPDHLMQPKN